jgi:hypothetical protein
MNQRNTQRLVQKFPTLFGGRFAFECGDGWYELIKGACEKLEPIMAVEKVRDIEGWGSGMYRAAQVKEKFGSLRFYLACAPEEAYKIVEEAERKSAKICEVCGKPGKLLEGGWLYTACKKHVRPPQEAQ